MTDPTTEIVLSEAVRAVRLGQVARILARDFAVDEVDALATAIGLDQIGLVATSRAGAALTHDERLSLAEQIRVAFDTPPDQRVIQDTWLYAAAMAEQWYVDRAANNTPESRVADDR